MKNNALNFGMPVSAFSIDTENEQTMFRRKNYLFLAFDIILFTMCAVIISLAIDWEKKRSEGRGC